MVNQNDAYVVKWHNVRAQLGAFEGTKAAALPTFVRECRQIADMQT
jgi:hypothetical protein